MPSPAYKKNAEVNPDQRQQLRNRHFPVFQSLAGFLVVFISLFYGFDIFPSQYKSQDTLHHPGMSYSSEKDCPKKCILYHTDWANYARNFHVKDIPIEGVTDIAYAFFNLQDSGGGNWIITAGDA
jgi:hypothetical protein